jgi:hypothetical protein
MAANGIGIGDNRGWRRLIGESGGWRNQQSAKALSKKMTESYLAKISERNAMCSADMSSISVAMSAANRNIMLAYHHRNGK